MRAAEELEPAVAIARRHDDKVLIEENVDGIEVECGVLGNRTPIASLPGEIVAHGFEGADWYDFSAKYDEGGMDLIVPPRIPADVIARVQESRSTRSSRPSAKGWRGSTASSPVRARCSSTS